MKRSLMKKIVGIMTLDEIIDMIFIDPISGIPNRRAFDTEEFNYIAIIDMDSLKWVNDNRGHVVGDAYLRVLGTALADAFPDKAYHLSGDEFAVVGESASVIFNELLALRHSMNSFSFGVGSTLRAADADMHDDKERREKSGNRSPRGEAPHWDVDFILEHKVRKIQ